MHDTTAQRPTDGSTTGVFTYMDETVRPSLYRNGEVYTKRDLDGSDTPFFGATRESRNLTVHDARALAASERRTCRSNGFELFDAPLTDDGLDFFDHETVVREYYGQCEKLVADATGARVYAFDHNIRSASGKKAQKRIAGGQQVQGPALLVHGDYTLTSAPRRLRDLTKPPTANDTLAGVLPADAALIRPADAQRALNGGRFAIINVWRNIADTPVETHPFALCDGQTVGTGELVVFEIHYQDRIGENYFAKYAPEHRWYYYPKMTRSEALLLKQWDSDGPLARSDGELADSADPVAPCTFSFHTAFEDSNTPDDAPDRWSIEVRCMAVYD